MYIGCTNMKKISLATIILLTASSAMAESQIQVGLGYTRTTVSGTDNGSGYEEYVNAPALVARYAFSNNIAIEGAYRFKSGDTCDWDNGNSCTENPRVQVNGIDINLLLGDHFIDQDHFYYFAGVGFFSDNWNRRKYNRKDTISGAHFPFGLGYNTGKFSLETQYTYRLGSAYDNGLNGYFETDTSAYSLALKLMYSL